MKNRLDALKDLRLAMGRADLFKTYPNPALLAKHIIATNDEALMSQLEDEDAAGDIEQKSKREKRLARKNYLNDLDVSGLTSLAKMREAIRHILGK